MIIVSMIRANSQGHLVNVPLLILLMESDSVSFNLSSHSTKQEVTLGIHQGRTQTPQIFSQF